jgi:hypothetical protein
MRDLLCIFGYTIILAGCQQMYTPEINNQKSAIVVEGILTNNPGEAVVKLSKAVAFDSTNSKQTIEDASVLIHDDQGVVYNLYRSGRGIYSDSGLFAQSGHTYALTVITSDGTSYESAYQQLPVTFKQDSIYVDLVTKTILQKDSYGDNMIISEPEIETYVDLSSINLEIPKCRYEIRTTVMYFVPNGMTTSYIWKTFNPNFIVSLTPASFDKSKGIFKKFSICSFSNDVYSYDISPNANIYGFLLVCSKYSLSKETHIYYEDIDNQLVSTGHIFDPVAAQLKGNLKCTTDTSKLVLGNFEVSNSQKYYYRYQRKGRSYALVEKTGFPEFSPDGETVGQPPAFWYY